MAQLIAHEKEVYDIAFSTGVNTFVSAGADGSIRFFDMRDLERSTIMYESNDQMPFARVSLNRHNPNLLATFTINSKQVVIIDIRFFTHPFLELNGHTNFVNGISWAPNSEYLLYMF